MDTENYRKMCSAPDAFSRGELEKTLVALEKSGSATKNLISEVLQSEALEKPELHHGGQRTDYFLVCIGAEDANEITEELSTLEVQAVSSEGHTTPLASHYAALLDRWHEYVESL